MSWYIFIVSLSLSRKFVLFLQWISLCCYTETKRSSSHLMRTVLVSEWKFKLDLVVVFNVTLAMRTLLDVERVLQTHSFATKCSLMLFMFCFCFCFFFLSRCWGWYCREWSSASHGSGCHKFSLGSGWSSAKEAGKKNLYSTSWKYAAVFTLWGVACYLQILPYYWYWHTVYFNLNL